MNWEIILTVVAFLCTVVAVVIGYYLHVRKKIEQEALNAINEVEKLDKIGAEKMADAVDIVYDAIPVVAKPFVTKGFIETIIQTVFDKVEDYARKQADKTK